MIIARVVPSKEAERYAVETAKQMVERFGYRRIMMRRNHEPATLALMETVRRECNVRIGQFRVIKDALESNPDLRLATPPSQKCPK